MTKNFHCGKATVDTFNKRIKKEYLHTHFRSNIVGKYKLDKDNDEVDGQIDEGGNLRYEVAVVHHGILHKLKSVCESEVTGVETNRGENTLQKDKGRRVTSGAKPQ